MATDIQRLAAAFRTLKLPLQVELSLQGLAELNMALAPPPPRAAHPRPRPARSWPAMAF